MTKIELWNCSGILMARHEWDEREECELEFLDGDDPEDFANIRYTMLQEAPEIE